MADPIRRPVCASPNNVSTSCLDAGDIAFQLLPTNDSDTSVPPTDYVITVDGIVFQKGKTGSDGTVKLPMFLGGATGVQIGGLVYTIAVDPSPNLAAIPLNTLPSWSGVTVGFGMGLHNLAFNDLSWLRSVNSRAYWSPLVPNFGIPLERSLDVLPRDLSPKLGTYLQKLKPGDQGAWLNINGRPISYRPDPNSTNTVLFTANELRSIEGLVARYNANPASLSATELQLLREAVRIHLDGATMTAPLASYSQPGTVVGWTGQRAYRVRVSVARSQTIDISRPNDFNQGVEHLTNVGEAEVMVVGDQTGSIVSVIPAKALNDGSWIFRNADSIRWGGRIVMVGGFAYSVSKIASAPPDQQTHVLGEEVGGQVGGFAGAGAGTAACIGFGIATEGAGLFVCGLIGGVVGGTAGSAAGGAAGDAVSDWLTDAAWKALHHSAEQQGDFAPPGAEGAADWLVGDPVFP